MRAAAPPLDRSRISVLSDEVGATLADAVAFAKQYRIWWMEMRGWDMLNGWEMYDRMPLGTVKEHARVVAGNGLRVSFFDSSLLKCTLPGTSPVTTSGNLEKVYRQLGLTPEKLFRQRVDDLRRVLEVAAIFGTRKVRAFTFWRVKDPAGVRTRIADVLNELGEVAAKAGFRILVETEPVTNMASSEETAALFGMLPGPGVAINWDPQNSTEWEKPFPDGYRILPRHRIENVHVKYPGLLDPKQRLDWPGIFRAMQADGYQGEFALETHYGVGRENIQPSHPAIREMLRLIGEEV